MNVVVVPDLLNTATSAEELIEVVARAEPRQPLVLDLSAVRWICPYGAILLSSLCRYQAFIRGRPVSLSNARPDVRQYLHDINFFLRSSGVAKVGIAAENYPSERVGEWTVLEMLTIRGPRDAAGVYARAHRALADWDLNPAANSLVERTISEMVKNVIDHSESTGLITLQRYARGRGANVQVAIGDFGVGIAESLRARRMTANTVSAFIDLALKLHLDDGGDFGHGLAWLERTALRGGGSIVVRSGTGLLRASATQRRALDGRPALPGTQLAVRLEFQ